MSQQDKAAAEKAAAEKAEQDKAAAEKAEEDRYNKLKGSFIMAVTHLNWGPNGASHFYADKKPLITAKVMRGYESTLLIWIKEGWVKKGSYK